MSVRLRALTPVVLAVGGIGVACSPAPAGEEAPRAEARAGRPVDVVMTPQDLSEARRRAGFESASEIEEKERRRIVEAAEAHITERLDRYLGVLDAIESDLAELERSAPKLTTAAALAKFGRTHQRAHAKLEDAFAELERRGAEGGELHGAAKRVFERWQDLVSGLEPNVAEDPRFEAELKGIREALAELRSALEALAPGDGVNGSGPPGRTGSKRPDAPR